MRMTNKSDILNKYARKHDVSASLLSKVFEIERARLHIGDAEAHYRREQILELLRNWAAEKTTE